MRHRHHHQNQNQNRKSLTNMKWKHLNMSACGILCLEEKRNDLTGGTSTGRTTEHNTSTCCQKKSQSDAPPPPPSVARVAKRGGYPSGFFWVCGEDAVFCDCLVFRMS